ncbi:glycosyltransferase family 2 protein [Paenibacillus sp. PL2-23]|uniref:glycosyltransferase family 2 protein n=1 Tax=Paenibacillus sp. PL2-23 TaxID=2100729 RepID=UPI0030F50EA9
MSQISVIVPVHNPGRKLRRCIRSILDQSFSDWSLLLIDDGSSDGSLELCKSYAAQDERIQVISQQQAGSTVARKRGIEHSCSPFVAWVDADDWMARHALGRLYDRAVRSGADIVVGDMTRVTGGGGLIRKSNPSPYCQEEKLFSAEQIRSELVPAFLHGHPFPVQFHGKLYRRELLQHNGTYSSRICFFGDDLYYNLELFLHAKSVYLIPDCLYYYRIGGMTSRYMPCLFQDAVRGYQIQKEVIATYYEQEQAKHQTGARVMLLNTLMTCIHYLFLSKLSREEKLVAIQQYCVQPEVCECVNDEAVAAFIDQDVVRFIRQSDSSALYELGKWNYTKLFTRRMILKMLKLLQI